MTFKVGNQTGKPWKQRKTTYKMYFKRYQAEQNQVYSHVI